MLIACLDTSTNTASFSLFKDGEKVLSLSEECHKGASKLLPYINDQIKQAGFKVHEINHWKVGKGPGSFTGMRVGIAYVKGICYASGASFEGVNSGFGYIHSSLVQDKKPEQITYFHDGRRQEVIANTFSKTDGVWSESSTQVLKISYIGKNLDHLGILLTSMDLNNFPEALQEKLISIETIDAGFFTLLENQILQNTSEMDQSCEPIYVRPPVFVNPAVK